MRIPDQTIEAIRRIPGHDVCGWLGLESARERNKYACPVCGSKNNLHAFAEGVYCYSPGCEADNTDNIDLVQAGGLDFIEACQWLADNAGIDLDTDGARRAYKPPKRSKSKRTQQRAKIDESRLQRVWDFYDRLWRELVLTDEAAHYLEGRGIPRECAELAGIRSSWPDQWRELKGFDHDLLRDAGMMHPDESKTSLMPFWWWKGQFLVFPYWRADWKLWRADRRVSSLRFRRIFDHDGCKVLSARTAYGDAHKPEMPFLGAYQTREATSILYVTEGELDALSVRICGRPAIGAPGAGAWRDEWSQQLGHVDQIVILADGDEAGRTFAGAVAKSCREHGSSDVRAFCADGLDPNDMLQRGTLRGTLAQVERGIAAKGAA